MPIKCPKCKKGNLMPDAGRDLLDCDNEKCSYWDRHLSGLYTLVLRLERRLERLEDVSVLKG